MSEITRETLECYLDDALTTAEVAEVERALRESAELRQLLRTVIQDGDRGDHSIGAIWRRQRLTCPGREQLGSYLLGALDPDEIDYFDFHLKVIACPFCNANLTDLQSLRSQATEETRQRRKRIYESGIGLLPQGKDGKSPRGGK